MAATTGEHGAAAVRPRRLPVRRPGRQWGRVLAGFALLASGTGVLVTLGAEPADAGPRPVILGYVPLPADDFQRGLETINAAADATLDYTVGITNAGNGSVVVFDHWEDGFEADLAAPVQPTTQVWGDGVVGNGDAATHCTSCTGDLLTPGDVFVLRNNITTPRNPAELRFDGGDKVAATRGFAITVGGWSTPLGSVFADAVAAYDITKFGTSFVVPIGQDSPYPTGSTPAFEYTGASVMAAVDGTTVDVDREGDGTIDVTGTIDEGETLYVDGGLRQGALITSSDPVQVHLITGDVGASYEARFFELFPVELASHDYVNPVGSATANQETVTYLYNPNDDAITVTPTCTGCSTPIVMPGHSAAQLASPLGRAVRFTSGGQPFIAVGAMGAHSGAGGQTDSTSTYDWGFSLIPAGLLTTQAVLGWAPGNSALPPTDDDDGPVWVTTTAPTTVRVDYDGDPTTGALATDCFGLHDVELSVAALVSTRLTDVADNDMTGARVYTCDGTPVIGAWGEDPGSAPAGNPGLDAGYTLLPSTVMVVDKNDGLYDDANGDGRYGPGDTIEYSISIGNAGNLTFTNLVVDDTLPAGLSYVAGSTVVDDGNDQIPIPDDISPPAATIFPLDEGGAALPELAMGVIAEVRFRAEVVEPFPSGGAVIGNAVVVTADQSSAYDQVFTSLVEGDVELSLSQVGSPIAVGDDGVFRVGVTNVGPDTASDVVVHLDLGAHASYGSDTVSQGDYDEGTARWSVGSLASGASATLEVTAGLLDPTVQVFAQVEHAAVVDPDSTPAEGPLGPSDPPDEDDEATVTVSVLPVADLELTMSRTAGPDVLGDTTFRLVLHNAGPYDATDVAVTDLPPGGASSVSATPSTGTFDSLSNVWQVGPLASGATATLDVTYRVTTFPSTNLAQVSAVDEFDPDSAPGEGPLGPSDPPDQDDEASADVPAIADVSLTVAETASPAHAGDPATFVVTASNLGPATSTGVVVSVPLPASLVHTGHVAGTGTFDPGTGEWELGDLAPSGSATLTIDTAVTAVGTSTVVAEVWSAPVDDPDSEPGNGADGEDDRASAAVTTTGGTLGDRVWFDGDGDGAQDAGEPGLAGVDLDVRWAGPNGVLDDGDDVVRAATTAADGTWSVDDLASGTYRVTVATGTLPPGISAATADPDGPGTPHVAELLLAGGSARTDADFGARGAGAVGGAVFHDVDGDGAAGAGEGTASVDVTVRWAGANGVLGDGDDAVTTVATDAGGSWVVDGLPAGTIRTVVDSSDLPVGATSVVDPDGGADFRSDLVLADAEVATGHDHGYVVPAPISGSVFEDTDADGTVDAGEGGLPSIEVVLEHDADGDGAYETPFGSLTTDGDGTYGSSPLPPGRYRVTVTVPSGAVATTVTVHEVVVVSADDAVVPPVGLVTDPARSIGDLVWFDADGDGGVDPGEPGLAGIGVEVRWAGPDRVLRTGDDRVRSTSTGAAGEWSVDELLPGDHEVTVEEAALPAGLDVATADPDGPGSAGVAVVTVPVGSDRRDVDFGYRGRASLAGTVFHDADADRAPGAGEGVAGVGVTLTWSGPNGTWGDDDDAVVQTVTGSDGSYSVDGLPAGPVHLVVDVDGLPHGAVSVVDPDGGADFASGRTLAAGEQVTGHDHGLVVPMPLTGLVWEDADADGIVDPDEEGAPDVGVVVRGDLDGDGTYELLVGELTAAGDGLYTSGPLLPGRYRVTLVVPEGAVATTSTVREITVVSGEEAVVDDMGIVSVPAVATGDLVWFDVDGDAEVDPGEPGLPEVEVTVRWAGPDGELGTDDDRVRTTTTDDVGAWIVDELVPGEHEVSVDPLTRPTGLDAPTADPDGTASADTALVVLPAGGRDDVDFGYRGRATVGGIVFHDLDADEAIDAEEPLDGVTVTVTWSGPNGTFGDGDDAVVEVVTEADGRYAVGGLPAGTVRVEVDGEGLPAGAVVLVDPDDDVGAWTDGTLAPGEQAVDLRFGVVVPGSIGRRVWADLDGDGLMDDDEPGLAGVRVTLFEDTDGDGVYETDRGSQTTASDGTYRFSGLLPSDYRVQVDPESVPAGGGPTTPLTVDVRLGASAEFEGGNFGFQAVPPSTAPSTTRPNRLPDTGSDPGTPVAIGAVLVLAGLVLAGAARRRRPA